MMVADGTQMLALEHTNALGELRCDEPTKPAVLLEENIEEPER